MPLAGSRPGRAVTCTMAPEPRCRMYGATAWLSHSAGPRLTSSMSRSVSGVVASASPRRKVPTTFTSTPGGPASAAIRLMASATTAGSAGSAATLRTLPLRSFIACSLRSSATTAKPLAASAATVACPRAPPAPATTATVAWLMPYLRESQRIRPASRPGRAASRLNQPGPRRGERSSPDPGDYGGQRASMNTELPVRRNTACWSGDGLAERVMGRRGQRRPGEGFLGLVVPEPLFTGFEALHDRMAGSPPVQGGVLGGRGIAAADMPALGAAPQVYPPASSRVTFGAA